MPALLSAFDIVEDAGMTERPQPIVTAVYFAIGARLGLDWLRDRILELARADRWQALARAALRDELYQLHRALTRDVLASVGDQADSESAISAWLERNEGPIRRAESVLADVKASQIYDTTTLPVALRELKNLVSEDGYDTRAVRL
jgi:glutamate dehydrogenase